MFLITTRDSDFIDRIEEPRQIDNYFEPFTLQSPDARAIFQYDFYFAPQTGSYIGLSKIFLNSCSWSAHFVTLKRSISTVLKLQN